MRRALQALALLQVVLIVALLARTVVVLRVAPPEFGEIPDLPAETSLPVPIARSRIAPAVTDAVVGGDLFDTERGQGQGDGPNPDDVIVDAAPVPPPATVRLAGVMVVDGQPVAFLADPTVGPEQRAVRSGDMFGEYEVGTISLTSVILNGSADEQFNVPLRIDGAAGAGAAPPPARPTPPGRPASARPATARNDAAQRAMSARERAQAIAQRNADARNRNQAGGKERGGGGAQADDDAGKSDPVQARLEALRRLREAAQTR